MIKVPTATTQNKQRTPTLRMMRFVAVVLCIQVTFRSASGVRADCKQTERGTEYDGHLSVTKSGKKCFNWADLTFKQDFLDPDKASEHFPEKSLEDAVNYCRNPDDTIQGPWCYFNDEVFWEACDVPRCPVRNCKNTARGTDYSGTLSVTKSGKACLRWAFMVWVPTGKFPDLDNPTKNFPEDDLEDAVNYCRNPDDAVQGPWCYVDVDGTFEDCDIPDCSD